MRQKPNFDAILGQNIPDVKNSEFQSWLIIQKKISERQAYNYNKYAGKLCRANAVYENISKMDVNRVVEYIRTSKYSRCHQIHLITVFELFLQYRGVKDEHGVPYKFAKPRPNKKAIKYLTKEQMEAFIRSTRDYQEFAMVMTFLTTGVRLSELTALNVGDVDLDNAKILVEHGKGDKSREVPLSDQTVQAIREYFVHYNIPSKAEHPLFTSSRGNRISNHTVQKIIGRIGTDSGMKFRITPHILRHSFASHCIANGCDIYSLKELLGHSDIKVTEVYLHLDNSAKRQAYNRGVPRF